MLSIEKEERIKRRRAMSAQICAFLALLFLSAVDTHYAHHHAYLSAYREACFC